MIDGFRTESGRLRAADPPSLHQRIDDVTAAVIELDPAGLSLEELQCAAQLMQDIMALLNPPAEQT